MLFDIKPSSFVALKCLNSLEGSVRKIKMLGEDDSSLKWKQVYDFKYGLTTIIVMPNRVSGQATYGRVLKISYS